jgi:hypothetical protein
MDSSSAFDTYATRLSAQPLSYIVDYGGIWRAEWITPHVPYMQLLLCVSRVRLYRDILEHGQR